MIKLRFIFILLLSVSIQIEAQLKVHSSGNVSVKTTTEGNHFCIGTTTGPNSLISSFGSDFRICKYSAGNQWAYIQGRDLSGSNSIGIGFRTQNNGGLALSMEMFPNGDIVYYHGFTGSSDLRFKRNVTHFTQQDVDNLYSLEPVSYNRLISSDSSETEVISDVKSYGLIAQDLREVYPDLVKEDQNQYLSVDYIGLIPLLIEAVKYQRLTILDLQAKIDTLTISEIYKSALKSSVDVYHSTSNRLFQNTPNPFNQDTEIKVELDQNCIKAILNIYDMQGIQLSTYEIMERGNASVLIDGSELNPGIYLYTLIVDGIEIDTKRMILTEN